VIRRYRCDTQHCRRRIFAERFDRTVLLVRSRRTSRLDCIVHHLGLALGGRPAASFAKRLMLQVSNDTVLRVVRARAYPRTEPLNVVGIDDWAFRRNHSYGTIVCDLERRRIVTLLPDREMATVEAWLAGHPDITVLSRDRGGGYGEAASKALPCAIQVADRWHLMENASSAFLSAVRKSMRPIRAAIGATTINPELLTCAERLQYEGYLRREETITTILALAKDGTAIKQIVRKTGHSRNRVRQVLRGAIEVSSGHGKARSMRTCLCSMRNGLEAVGTVPNSGGGSNWMASAVRCGWSVSGRADAVAPKGPAISKVPSARTIARLMTSARDHMSKADTVTIAAIEAGVPTLTAARTLTNRFHTMIRNRKEADLVPWIAAASDSLIGSFASGVTKDIAVVHAALVQPWSNGQTEGQITKLKLVKRRMYGRAKIDLLQARLIGAT
jgi:transposase